nr:hypothetical protein BgiMline_032768 [Biomphalaria glabrata]
MGTPEGARGQAAKWTGPAALAATTSKEPRSIGTDRQTKSLGDPKASSPPVCVFEQGHFSAFRRKRQHLSEFENVEPFFAVPCF